MKLGARVDIGRFKPRKQDFDPLAFLRRQAFGPRRGFALRFGLGFGWGFGLADHGQDHAPLAGLGQGLDPH